MYFLRKNSNDDIAEVVVGKKIQVPDVNDIIILYNIREPIKVLKTAEACLNLMET